MQHGTEDAGSGIFKQAQCKILTTLGAFEDFADDWRRLWESDPQREIFQHFEWILSWIRAYKKERALYMPVVFDERGVIGILPLVFENRTLRFAGHSVSDYNGLVCDSTCAAQVLETAMGALLSMDCWDRIVLENVPAQSSLGECLERIPSGIRRRMEVIRGVPCPALVLQEGKERILAGLLSKSKRKVNALRRLGNLRFRHIEDRDELKAYLPTFYRQHIHRWAVDGIRSRFLENESVEFYETLLARLRIHDQIRFSVLELEDRPIACLLAFQVNGKYSFYKPTFDIDFWDYSPGLVLLFNVFRHIQTADVREFDFGLGGETYKYRFSNLIRRNLEIYVHRPSVRAMVIRAGLRLKEGVRNQPLIAPVLYKLTERWRRVLAGATWNSIRHLVPALEFEWILYPPERNVAKAAGMFSWKIAAFSELAGFAWKYPAHFDRIHLRQARIRLQQGETPCLIAARGRLCWLFWMRGGAPQNGSAVMYDFWRFPGANAAEELHDFPELLRRIASEQGLQGWKLHVRPRLAPPILFRSAGFRISKHMVRVRFFRSSWTFP